MDPGWKRKRPFGVSVKVGVRGPLAGRVQALLKPVAEKTRTPLSVLETGKIGPIIELVTARETGLKVAQKGGIKVSIWL